MSSVFFSLLLGSIPGLIGVFAWAVPVLAAVVMLITLVIFAGVIHAALITPYPVESRRSLQRVRP
jgi:hypothetical protein